MVHRGQLLKEEVRSVCSAGDAGWRVWLCQKLEGNFAAFHALIRNNHEFIMAFFLIAADNIRGIHLSLTLQYNFTLHTVLVV